MHTPGEERKRFDHVMCLITSTADEVVSPGSLSVDVIEQVCPFLLLLILLVNVNLTISYCCNFDTL